MTDHTAMLMRALHGEATKPAEAKPTPLQTEARIAHLKEVLDEYDREPEYSCPFEIGDLVVHRPYMECHTYPSTTCPGIVHELIPIHCGHEAGETQSMYRYEVYDCVVAVLLDHDDGATLMFVPANSRRLKKYEPYE